MMPAISDEDLEMIREELEARANGFRAAWPAREILIALHRTEGLLARLPQVDSAGATRKR